MALTDTFVENVKHTGDAFGDKYTDGRAMYLLVNAAGKYWRVNYRFTDKRKACDRSAGEHITGLLGSPGSPSGSLTLLITDPQG